MRCRSVVRVRVWSNGKQQWTVRGAADVVRELSHLDLKVPLHTTLNIHKHHYQRLYTRAKLILHMRKPFT